MSSLNPHGFDFVFEFEEIAPKEKQRKGRKIYRFLADKEAIKLLKICSAALRNKRNNTFNPNDHVDVTDREKGQFLMDIVSKAYDEIGEINPA